MKDLLLALIGRSGHRGPLLVVTERGVEIPIVNAGDWTLVDLNRTLAQIDALPESRRGVGGTDT